MASLTGGSFFKKELPLQVLPVLTRQRKFNRYGNLVETKQEPDSLSYLSRKMH